MVEALDREPRAVLVASARLILDEASQVMEVWNELGDAGFHEGADVIIRCMQQDRNLVGEPSALLFRRIPAARGFDPTFRQVVDQEMWFHLLQSAGMVYLPEPLCAFRRHPAQQTVVNEKQQLASGEVMRIVARYFDLFAASVGLRPDSFAMRRRLFRHLYYARKDNGDSPLAAIAEATLMPHVTRRWYFICWLIHRATKPFVNLHRFCTRFLRVALLPRPMESAASLAPTTGGRMSAGGIFPARNPD
jgi:hypothetical protein